MTNQATPSQSANQLLIILSSFTWFLAVFALLLPSISDQVAAMLTPHIIGVLVLCTNIGIIGMMKGYNNLLLIRINRLEVRLNGK